MKTKFSKSVNDLTEKTSGSKLSSLFKLRRHRPQASQDLASLDLPGELQRRQSTSSYESLGPIAFAPAPTDQRPAGSTAAKPPAAAAPLSAEEQRNEAIRKNQQRLAEKALQKTDQWGGPKRAPAKSLDRMSISSVVGDLPAEPLGSANTSGMKRGKSMHRAAATEAPRPDMETFRSLTAGRDMKAMVSSWKQQSEDQQRQYDRLRAEKTLKSSRSAPSLKKSKGKAKQAGPVAE